MRRVLGMGVLFLLLAQWLPIAEIARGEPLRLLQAAPDPYGYPRPAAGATEAPLATSLFFQIGFAAETGDHVLPESVAVQLGPRGEPAAPILEPGERFVSGYSGRLIPGKHRGAALAVYLDSPHDLEPATTYVVSVQARSQQGAVLSGEAGVWEFTTAAVLADTAHRFRLDLAAEPVHWQGGFFTGFCKPSFCTSSSNRLESYALMDRVRYGDARTGDASEDARPVTRAWSLQRDFWPTGMQHQPQFLCPRLPNVVRELETRRIVAIEPRGEARLLRVEDFFGHEQYGIESGRPLSADYQPGDDVLIADGVNHARARVLEILQDGGSEPQLLVTAFDEPDSGWRIEYAEPLPREEDPDAPGWFAAGGCYLRKFQPAGTPRYFWERLNHEWDIAHRRFGRRLVVNFADAPGDLSVDGQNWTYPKDYVQYHQVVHAFTTHLIDRYGEACLDFYWSVLNEPDLARAFWRSGDWKQLQKFYDYTVDAILRAFEDRGLDSDRVRVGGLEIGAIFGTRIENPILADFLSHCSPHATRAGALPYNAAMADPRLDGRRSRRVEQLCAETGKGSPCDFISVHSYNASETMAAKLIRAKQLALEIDPEFYRDLWVNSFEACPDWAPPPDVAAADSYLGNGYFPTWCADVARRLLAQAATDPRYAFGESILTFWPWPNQNFGGHNAATRMIAVDETGDGRADRHQAVAMPILHFLGLLGRMGDRYLVLPEKTAGGHVLSGFASETEQAVKILLYSHHAQDVQSRTAGAFQITMQIDAVPWSSVRLSQYRFDQHHNSYYHLGRELRDRSPGGPELRRPDAREIARIIAALESGEASTQIDAIREVARFADVPTGVFTAAMHVYEATRDPQVRGAIEEVAAEIQAREVVYTPDEVAQVQSLAELQVTPRTVHVSEDGRLEFSVDVAANGANFLILEPSP